ncbi:hypothetical protein CY652_22965 [Burkholderia sp. WAC0059]|nr:hypothetical protein CY652_22965 [Burkholderia sp. WAC0059]
MLRILSDVLLSLKPNHVGYQPRDIQTGMRRIFNERSNGRRNNLFTVGLCINCIGIKDYVQFGFLLVHMCGLGY